MSHLAIRIDGKYAVIKSDTSVDITLTNPYFNDTAETMSLPFTLPTAGNGALFGNVEVIESDFRLHDLEKKVMQVEVDGVLLAQGKVGNIDDQRISGEVGLQMVSSVYSLDEYLDGVRCRDVPVDDNIIIGETIGNISATLSYKLSLKVQYLRAYYEPVYGSVSRDISESVTLDTPFPALGFSIPATAAGDGAIGVNPTIDKSYINVAQEYTKGSMPYCNMRVCYMHHGKDEKTGESNDTVLTAVNEDDDNNRYNPYFVLEADRPASGICFYVLYFLQKLFDKFMDDGIVYDDTELYRISDMRRLAFFTTHCKFVTRKKAVNSRMTSLDNINRWLSSRNIDTKLTIDTSTKQTDISQVTVKGEKITVGDLVSWSPIYWDSLSGHTFTQPRRVGRIYYEASGINVEDVTANVMYMYATSLNFPDADAKDVIDSMWASFGVRFNLDQQTRRVKPVFIRDILRSRELPVDFNGEVITAVKSVKKTTGFSMQYSGESDKQQRQDNITLGLVDYDTVYDYEDYQQLVADKSYGEILTAAYDTNMNCYVDYLTGNRYRVKIDHDAEERNMYHPVIFEVGQLHGVEIGDCTEENDEFVEHLASSFQPVILNDVNFHYERKESTAEDFLMIDDSTGQPVTLSSAVQTQKLAAFIGEDMWHENIGRVIRYPLGNSRVAITLDAAIITNESYDVQSSNDGDSPLQSMDWGLAVTMMRGGGYDASMYIYDDGWDVLEGMRNSVKEYFGCSKYRMKATSNYVSSYDSIDCWGMQYDYNGELPGIGDSGSVLDSYSASVSIRSVYSSSNADLLSASRQQVTIDDVRAKGWHMSNVYGIFFTASSQLTDVDDTVSEYLYTVIKDDGTILTPDYVEDYLNFLMEFSREHGTNVYDLDAAVDRILIGRYADATTANQYAELLNQLGNIYNSDTQDGVLTCPIPDGAYIHYRTDGDRFSLKIRSFIEAPADIQGPGDVYIRKGQPMCAPHVARRGLFDTFMTEYAAFVMHRKTVVLEIRCQPSELVNIDWTRRYRFGDYVGWINSIHVNISAEIGIEKCEVELYVL